MNHGTHMKHIASAHNKGFTLVELLVTLAVAAIVLIVGVPGYQNLTANQHSVASINELVTAMNLARSHALKTGKHVTVCRSNNGSTCNEETGNWNEGWIVFVNKSQAGTGVRDEDEELLRAFEPLHGNVSLIPYGSFDHFVAFRPTGDTDFSGSWQYCDSRGTEHAKAVGLFRSGRAQKANTLSDGSELNCTTGSTP